MASIVTCIVGSNTGAPDKASLHVLECDTETGAAKIVQTVKDIQGTTYFAIDRERKNLYSAIGEDGKGVIVKFALEDRRIGKMTRLATLPCETPCHVSLSPDGTRVAFAAYGSATCGTVGVDGRGLATYVFPNDAMGDNKNRQQKAFAHQTFFTDPNGIGPKMVGVVDLGCDRIRFFEPETMKVLPRYEIRADRGDGPRHALFPEGSCNKVLYVVNELDSSVSAQAFDGVTFTKRGKWSTLPDGFSRWETDGQNLATKAAAIKTTKDGKILMASNRGKDSIAFFSVGPTGELTRKNIAPLAGKFPRDFELMPGEKFMVVGHKMSNEIQVYAFDRNACTLTPVGSPIACWRPLCFQFL